MKTVILPIDSLKVEISLLSDDFRPKNVWVNRERTDEVETFNGKQVFQVDAAVKYLDTTLGAVRLETTSVLEAVPFGSVLKGSGSATVRISPKDAYSTTGAVFVETIALPSRSPRSES